MDICKLMQYSNSMHSVYFCTIAIAKRCGLSILCLLKGPKHVLSSKLKKFIFLFLISRMVNMGFLNIKCYYI